jgi:inner membrane protein
MDSVTHLVLGASLGEAILGKKIGNRAMLWGAAAGSLPDLDILLAPFQDEIGFLTSHRGITHCLLFVLVAGAILGWLVGRWHARHGEDTSRRDWVLLFMVCLLTHVLLDACTTYGTPLLLPWSDYRVALNNIFILDPMFTLPLLLGVGYCLLWRPNVRRRQLVCYAAIGLSCLYLGATFAGKCVVQRAFTTAMAEEGIESSRFMTAPTPINSILWYCLAEDKRGYHVGYYSLLARRKKVEFTFVARNEDLLAGIRHSPLIERLIWFSNGYYAVRRQKKQIVFDVLKFGIFSLDADVDHSAFSFTIERDANGQPVVRNISRPRNIDVGKVMARLWNRILGRS